MLIHKDRTVHPAGRDMSFAAGIETMERLARGMVDRQRTRTGQKLACARKAVAARIGILPGTLATLARKRLKRIDDWIKNRIADAAIKELEREIESLRNEMEIARLCRPEADLDQVFEIQALHERARAALAALKAAGKAASR